MYGPPPRRKRKMKAAVGLRKCMRPLLERVPPGHDGMCCAQNDDIRGLRQNDGRRGGADGVEHFSW